MIGINLVLHHRLAIVAEEYWAMNLIRSLLTPFDLKPEAFKAISELKHDFVAFKAFLEFH